MNHHWQILLVAVLAAMLFSGIFAFAQETPPAGGQAKDYTLLQPLPGMGQKLPVEKILPAYLSSLFKFMLVLAGALAVLMLVFAGIMYITSGGNASTIEKAKSRIWSAIGGLVLAVSAYLILYTINPNLVNLNLGIEKITLTKKAPPPPPQVPLEVLSTKNCAYATKWSQTRAFVWVDFNGPKCEFSGGPTSDYIDNNPVNRSKAGISQNPGCGTRPADMSRSFKCCLLNITGEDATKWCGTGALHPISF